VTDYPTLGYDSNGYYIAANLYDRIDFPTATRVKIIAIRKPVSASNVTDAVNLANQNPLDATAAHPNLVHYVVQPAVSYDPVTGTDYAWFVAKGVPDSNPGGGAKISFFKLQWGLGTDYTLDSNPWDQTLPAVGAYYDADDQSGFLAPQKPLAGANPSKELYRHGSRLQTALIRNGYLWACHQIGINNSDSAYVSGGGDRTLRSAIQWFKVAVPLTTSSAVTSGRVFDAATSNPYWYYYPSLGANAGGDMLIGFSGSSTLEYIGAFYYGQKAAGSVTDRPVLVHGGKVNSQGDQWGHYSATVPDSVGYFWTIQEFPELPGGTSHLRTTLSKIRSN